MKKKAVLLTLLASMVFSTPARAVYAAEGQSSAVGTWEFLELENFNSGDKMKAMLETALAGSVLEIHADETYDLTLQGESVEGTYTESDETHLELSGTDTYSVTVEDGRLHLVDSADSSMQYVFTFVEAEEALQEETQEGLEQKFVGDTIDSGFMSMTLDRYEITDELHPDDTSGVELYYEKEDGKKYIAVRGRIENKSTENIDSNYTSFVLTVNDEIDYKAQMIILGNPASVTNFAITPYEEAGYIIYALVPEKALENVENLVITMKYHEGFNYQGDAEYEYAYEIPLIQDGSDAKRDVENTVSEEPAEDTETAVETEMTEETETVEEPAEEAQTSEEPPAEAETNTSETETVPTSTADAGTVYTDKNSVLQVQTALNIAGFDCGTPDGVNGGNTAESIKKYQEQHSLNVTGTVTEELIDYMRKNEFWVDLFINADGDDDQPGEVHRRDDFVAHVRCYNMDKAPLIDDEFSPYIPVWYKVTQPDGTLLKMYGDFADYALVDDGWYWVSWYFTNPDQAPTGTATFELYDTDDNLLAKMVYEVLS